MPTLIVKTSPFYKRIRNYDVFYQNKVVKSYMLGYSLNTLRKHKAARNFFKDSNVSSFEDIELKLEIFLIELCNEGKSLSAINSILDGVRFILSFLEYKNFDFTRLTKYLEKYCSVNKLNRIGFQQNHIDKIWDKKEKIGFKNFSDVNKRNFMMINFLYYTMCRFDDLRTLKCKHLEYENDIFTITIPKSKTDQQAHGQKVYLCHKKHRSPHRLLCEYIHFFKLQDNDYLFSPLKRDKNYEIWELNKSKPISYSTIIL